MTVSRVVAAAIILTAGLTAACTGSGGDGSDSTGPTTTESSGSTGAPTPCSKSIAKTAKTVVISGKGISPACVKLAHGKPLSIVNGGRAAVHGTMTGPSKQQTTVDLPHKNSVYPFKSKKKGTFKFTCKGCSNPLRIFVS